jgi:hypothetical protein
MITLKFSVNGKEINNSNDIKDAVNEMAQRGIEDMIRNKLSEYSLELSNSEINVDMATGKIQITNVPDGLREKIMKALQ